MITLLRMIIVNDDNSYDRRCLQSDNNDDFGCDSDDNIISIASNAEYAYDCDINSI